MRAQVTATSLNLRDAPNGTPIGLLLRGAFVDVVARRDGWAQVQVGGQPVGAGWVSAQYLDDGGSPTPGAPVAHGAATPLPVADDADHPVRVVGQNAAGPDGRTFARTFGSGFVSHGETPLPAWLGGAAAIPADISPSTLRVVSAVCANEGDLEAVNSYDACHMSFGIFQWTAGKDADPGELAVLLARLQAADAGAYEDCFGRYGLTPQVTSSTATTGALVLNGAPLQTVAQKDVLRRPEWAYRFWRAGHHNTVRACQLSLAAERIARFRALPVAGSGQTVGDWLTSEYGIALLLDEHVNRPGHVPGTLATGLHALSLTPAKQDPAHWTVDDEAKLIDAYLTARAATNMTDSTKRAARIAEAVRAGRISDKRGSFQP